jgi:tetratricopeptide (TPR) repeat protein
MVIDIEEIIDVIIDIRLLISRERHIESGINSAPVIPIDNDSVIQKCRDAIDKEPLNYWLWHHLSRLYIEQNDIDGAIQACKLGMKKWINNPSPLMELSNLYAAKGDYKTAISTSMELSKIDSIFFRIALKSGEIPLRLSCEVKLKGSLQR